MNIDVMEGSVSIIKKKRYGHFSWKCSFLGYLRLPEVLISNFVCVIAVLRFDMHFGLGKCLQILKN